MESEHDFIDNDLEEVYDEETQIAWSNLIFLPFHPIFKVAVLLCVLVKSILGPLQSVYPIVYCWDVMDQNIYLLIIKFFYWNCCDVIYAIDTILHIVHRQVTEKAMRRPYIPKSAFFLFLDIVALIPFFRLIVNVDCPPLKIWPNVVAFTEFVVVYRVVDYFELVTTHSFWNLVVGSTIFLICTFNCIACFWLLLTEYGLCTNCHDGKYDWRSNILYKLNESSVEFTTYVYASVFVISFTLSDLLDDIMPMALSEFVGFSVIVIFGYTIKIFIIMPKFFAESTLRIRRIFNSYYYVQMLINETKRRHFHAKAHINVRKFYEVMWQKRSGIVNIPADMMQLPRYLRIDIRQDLVWPVFYHSPILRKTSMPFKRFVCENIISDFKLPGERFFSGPQSYTNLYYIKSGILQILSSDEGTTPILSVSSGTIFGDISFLVPPLKRKVVLKCLTYCEVLILTRDDYLRALHRYPNDRKDIIGRANERLKHAKTLYTCKQNVKGLDRSKEEGIAWVKKRWWEITDSLQNWRKKASKKDKPISKWELPQEEMVYHCAKYIGQLVLPTDTQLQTKSLFTNVEFPWVLAPHSSLVTTWNRIVLATIFCVLITYPPNITRHKDSVPTWFRFFEIWTNIIYFIDICVSLTTAMSLNKAASNFKAVVFARCKTCYFNLDILATLWFEYIAIIVGQPKYSNITKFNRLIKIYKLFTDEFTSWNINRNPKSIICYRVVLTNFSFYYISSYIVYSLAVHMPNVTKSYFFGISYCDQAKLDDECDPAEQYVLGVALSRTLEKFVFYFLPLRLIDIYIVLCLCLPTFLITMYCASMFMSAIYMQYRDISNYQHFVTNLKDFYRCYKIHKDLLNRLDRYLLCHWKYYHGAHVLSPNVLNEAPFDIFWKVQGEVAQRIISESPVFLNADPALIRELACTAKMLVLPSNSTMFLFGTPCKNVTWIVQGHVKSEYYDENGELSTSFNGPGYMLSVSSVFLGKVSVKTYTSCTDCEILYINVQDFFKIIKHYPNEWMIFKSCIKELEPVFEKMFKNYILKHIDNQNKQRDKIFERISTSIVLRKSVHELAEPKGSIPTTDFWSEPNSTFMQFWMPFRAIIVIISIISASLQGGSGALIRRQLNIVGAFCDCIAWTDIVIKMFLAYYNELGILVTDKQKCAVNYLTRGFVLDVVGALPLYKAIRALVSIYIEEEVAMLINTFCKFGHLHILLGYFDYISDLPTSNFAYIMIFKWQLVTLLATVGASHFLMSYCVNYEFDDQMNLVQTMSVNTCWLPKYYRQKMVDEESLHVLFAESLNLAHSGLMGIQSRFDVDRHNIGVGIMLGILLLLFWFVTGYCIVLLVLNARGDSVFHHSVQQLRKFLMAERVEECLINRAVAHFSYWWKRTKGINIQHLTNERIGVIFRQDLSYYFLRPTFLVLDTLLHGGHAIGRQLASVSSQIFILPGEQIVREMDLLSSVFIVHRGRVTISQDGSNIKTLVKGSIFGILDTVKIRPVCISAKADGFADLLQINIKQFQNIINDNVREEIANNEQSKMDYMSIIRTKKYVEDPYDTIQYILRGRKTIKLPFMAVPLEFHHGNWYSRWLHFAWLTEPVVSAFVVLIVYTLPGHVIPTLNVFIVTLLLLCDAVNLINFVCDLYAIELVIVGKKCAKRHVGFRWLKRWSFYIDTLAFSVPSVTYFIDNSDLHMFRLLRLRHLWEFHHHFCTSFKSKMWSVIIKIVIVLLVLHTTSCGWIHVACRMEKIPFNFSELPNEITDKIDPSQWVLPHQREGGCPKLINYYVTQLNTPAFVVPKYWYSDYIISMTHMLRFITQTSDETVYAFSLKQIYYTVCVSTLIYLVDIWMMSVTVSFVYTLYRELYQYDFTNRNMFIYMRHSGLSPAVLDNLKAYSKHLWRRQRGNWLPELAQQAPICLREDLFCALYMHHLLNPPVFRDLPEYFRRQVAARLRRVVIFPGKCIVQEGDMIPCIYFIHEGEVEKWYIGKSGESRFMSVLSTNGYFGTMPGLFPGFSFQFTYYSRTVVDMVYLHIKEWEDLLNGYPKIKHDLYAIATQIRKEFGNFGKSS